MVRLPVLLSAAALGFASPALAQQEAGAGRTVYEAAYFQQYSPSNALDLVRRVPGFTLDLGAQDIRGFAQAAGNVVINGARPSSKSDTLETILARIPASRVARVEIGPGDLYGSDYSGKSQVANLFLTSEGGLDGTINATVRRVFTGAITPEGSASMLYRRGASTFTMSAGYNNSRSPEEGTDTITAIPGGAVSEFRRKHNDIHETEAFLTGSWEHDGGSDRTARLNMRVARERFELLQRSDVFPAAGPVRDDRLGQDFRDREFELGGDIKRPLWGGAIKLIGLATREREIESEYSLERIQGQSIGGARQDNDSRSGETVARLIWSRSRPGAWSLEAGAEGVLNSLDSDVNLYAVDAAGAETRIDLPVDQAKVKEWRGELFFNAGRPLSSSLRMDLGLTFEASRLTVSGDTKAERVLKFLKPRAVFDWKQGKWHAQLSLARTVAQLDFNDFVSSAELTNDRVDAGNADLVPQRAWEARLTVERPILGDGLAKVELGYNLIELLQDRVPTPEGFDAPGNIGTGRQAFVKGNLDVPLERFGIRGGRIDVAGTLQQTRVRDPYTHRLRDFSGFTDWAFEANFRQDLGKFAWGAGAGTSPANAFYRRDEIDKFDAREPYVTAFAEYRPSARTTITLGLDNVLEVPAKRLRTFFTPTRANPLPFEQEVRERNAHITTYLKLKQSFN